LAQGQTQSLQNHHAPMRKMMEKYSDLPMDLAGASLMYIANRENITEIASIDSDFDSYHTLKKQNLANVLDEVALQH
jgi:predicted nucleic acid-binding protein